MEAVLTLQPNILLLGIGQLSPLVFIYRQDIQSILNWLIVSKRSLEERVHTTQEGMSDACERGSIGGGRDYRGGRGAEEKDNGACQAVLDGLIYVRSLRNHFGILR